jgi:hypothetical protein
MVCCDNDELELELEREQGPYCRDWRIYSCGLGSGMERDEKCIELAPNQADFHHKQR